MKWGTYECSHLECKMSNYWRTWMFRLVKSCHSTLDPSSLTAFHCWVSSYLTQILPSVTILYLIMHRYDLIIMDSFSFQHSFVCFLHHFLLSSCIAAFHAIYRYLTPFHHCDSLELQRHWYLQSLTLMTLIPSHSHWSVHLLNSINTVELTVVFLS